MCSAHYFLKEIVPCAARRMPLSSVRFAKSSSSRAFSRAWPGLRQLFLTVSIVLLDINAHHYGLVAKGFQLPRRKQRHNRFTIPAAVSEIVCAHNSVNN